MSSWRHEHLNTDRIQTSDTSILKELLEASEHSDRLGPTQRIFSATSPPSRSTYSSTGHRSRSMIALMILALDVFLSTRYLSSFTLSAQHRVRSRSALYSDNVTFAQFSLRTLHSTFPQWDFASNEGFELDTRNLETKLSISVRRIDALEFYLDVDMSLAIKSTTMITSTVGSQSIDSHLKHAQEYCHASIVTLREARMLYISILSRTRDLASRLQQELNDATTNMLSSFRSGYSPLTHGEVEERKRINKNRETRLALIVGFERNLHDESDIVDQEIERYVRLQADLLSIEKKRHQPKEGVKQARDPTGTNAQTLDAMSDANVFEQYFLSVIYRALVDESEAEEFNAYYGELKVDSQPWR